MKLMHGEDEERNPFFLFKNWCKKRLLTTGRERASGVF
jgi:hypothetical protein